MDLQRYYEQRQKKSEATPKYRTICAVCIQPNFSCYCNHIEKFNPQIEFVILIHPIELRRRVATGRMSHLCLENSYLIRGQNFSDNFLVNTLVHDQNFHSVILYPGIQSQNLTPLTLEERCQLFPIQKKLRIFVIDGTWATARKMVRQSQNLHHLPRICFSPPAPSNFRVRKQPHAACYSTIEAIHHTIELLGPSQGFAVQTRQHDNLLQVFDSMVERQLEFIRIGQENPKSNSTYRRPLRGVRSASGA